jgi:hypothetical protein
MVSTATWDPCISYKAEVEKTLISIILLGIDPQPRQNQRNRGGHSPMHARPAVFLGRIFLLSPAISSLRAVNFGSGCSNLRSRRKAKLMATGLVALNMMAGVAFGQVSKNWIGTTPDWFTSSNWSPSGVPGPADDVFLSTVSPSPTDVAQTGAMARNLVIGLTGPGTLIVQNGGRINITGVNGLIVGFGGSGPNTLP